MLNMKQITRGAYQQIWGRTGSAENALLKRYIIRSRKWQQIGPTLRKNHTEIARSALKSKPHGQRRSGRPKIAGGYLLNYQLSKVAIHGVQQICDRAGSGGNALLNTHTETERSALNSNRHEQRKRGRLRISWKRYVESEANGGGYSWSL